MLKNIGTGLNIEKIENILNIWMIVMKEEKSVNLIFWFEFSQYGILFTVPFNIPVDLLIC